MDIYQRRPPPPADQGNAPASSAPEEAGGVCFLAPQSVLQFGSDRQRPTEYRHVVSVRSKGARRYVLPCTTARKRKFYRLDRDRCTPDPPRKAQRDNWLHHRVEVVSVHALRRLGVLVDGELGLILAWLRTYRREHR